MYGNLGLGFYGIYGLAVKKEFRGKGIGKEIIKQQLKLCRDKRLRLAFLQTEEGYYPADTYRKLGFKDVCTEYYYIKKSVREVSTFTFFLIF